jgi:phage virion morphogenesis protein
MDDLSNQLNSLIQGLANKDLTPALEVVAALIRSYIDQNFMQHGRWDGIGTDLFSGGTQHWKPLAPYTKKIYSKLGYDLEPTLMRTKNLYNSIEVRPKGNNSIVISVGADYASDHQFGALIHTKKGTRNIPARPFITLTQDDLNEIVRYFAKFFTS